MTFRIHHLESDLAVDLPDEFLMLLGFTLSTFENVALGCGEVAQHSHKQAEIRLAQIGLDEYYRLRRGFSDQLALAGAKVTIAVDPDRRERFELGDETGG